MAANIGYMRNACGSGDPAEVETVCGEFCALPKELALGHGSLHRAKLHSLPEMCAPAHSFVVSAVANPIYFPNSNVQGFPLLHILVSNF